MNKSENFNFNLPNRDNPEDLADINVISENFIIADTILKENRNAISSAEAKASEAKSIANAASGVANNAKGIAEEAKTDAEEAVDVANNANTKAHNAVSAAVNANETASEAKSIADEAKETAENAVGWESVTANALKGMASGFVVSMPDVSPLEHEIKVNLSDKKAGSVYLKDLSFSGGEMESGVIYAVDSCEKNDDESELTIVFKDDSTVQFSIIDEDPKPEILPIGTRIYYDSETNSLYYAEIDFSSVTLTKYGKNFFSKNIPSYSIGNSSVVDNGDGSITVTKKAGDAFGAIYSDYFHLNKGTYTISNGLGRDTVASGLNPIYLLLYPEGGSSVCSLDSRDYVTFTIEESGNFRVRLYSSPSTDVSSPVTIYPQIEIGDKYTGFEPFKEPISYTPNADGTVDGVTSYYPTTTLFTDTEGVTITAEYNRDANKVIEEFAEEGKSVRKQVGNLKNGLTDLDNFRLPLYIIEKEYISSNPALNGVPQKGNTWDRTDYTECGGLEHLYIKVPATSTNNAFYDEKKAFISIFSVAKSDDYYEVPIPENAKYFILSESRENLSQVVVKSKIGIAIDNVKVLTSPNGSLSYKILAILMSKPGYFCSFCFKASSL